MLAPLRNIGNSKGIIIPAAYLKQLGMHSEVELTLEGNALLLKAVQPLRKGWFEDYNPDDDQDPLAELVELDSEQEDWEW